MGLMDRVKAQATLAAQKAQEAAQQGKDKLDQAQANRRGDAMLRQLGVIVYADRTGRGTPDSQAKIDKLINDISAHERENGLNLAADPAQQPGAQQPGAQQPGAQQQPNFPGGSPGPFSGGATSTPPGAGGTDAGPTTFAPGSFFPGAGSAEPGDPGPT
jgi:hypothetical protein